MAPDSSAQRISEPMRNIDGGSRLRGLRGVTGVDRLALLSPEMRWRRAMASAAAAAAAAVAAIFCLPACMHAWSVLLPDARALITYTCMHASYSHMLVTCLCIHACVCVFLCMCVRVLCLNVDMCMHVCGSVHAQQCQPNQQYLPLLVCD